MTMVKKIGLLFALLALSAPIGIHQEYTIAPQSASAWPKQTSDLSVLTYNVKGLPWPVASGRKEALRAIGRRLLLMRTEGVQPQIVLLQEAFTDDSEAIASIAGYDYVVYGPSVRQSASEPPLGKEFAENAQWTRGEHSEPIANSGLLILSDYPIDRTQTLAFPDGACAGFDCLATKGAVIAWVNVPGPESPLAVANTHLNSRRSTHVAPDRADEVYAWQSAAVSDFIRTQVPENEAIIFGGDFNAGPVPARRAAFENNTPLGENQRDGLAFATGNGLVLTFSQTEAVDTVYRNRDKILYRSGPETDVSPRMAWVPFGNEETGPAMSDHTGFVVDFSFSNN